MLVPGLHPLTPVQRMQNKGQAHVYDLVVSPEFHPLPRLSAGSPFHPQGQALSPPGQQRRGPTPATPPPHSDWCRAGHVPGPHWGGMGAFLSALAVWI